MSAYHFIQLGIETTTFRSVLRILQRCGTEDLWQGSSLNYVHGDKLYDYRYVILTSNDDLN